MRYIFIWFAVAIPAIFLGQENDLPADFRSHNLTQFNASLLDPTFSTDRNTPRSLSVWTRWQWQTFDGDPTTLFINYTQNLDKRTSAGLGFFQNNTGIYLNTGGALNVAHSFPLGETSDLVLGANVFVFDQELANDDLLPNTSQDTTLLNSENAFLMRFSPGIRLNADSFSVAIAIGNALEFNFSDAERDDPPLAFTGMISYDFPVFLFNQTGFLRPQAYTRSIRNSETQFGLNTLLTHPKFWLQGGYNSFYGISGGAGITISEKLSLGGLVESGLDSPAGDQDPTFEIVASYFFGERKFTKPEKREVPSDELPIAEEAEQKRLEEEALKREQLKREQQRQQARQDSINKAKEAAQLTQLEQSRLDSIAKVEREKEAIERERLQKEQRLAQAKQDSINRANAAARIAALEKARLDSIAKVEREKEVEVRPGEKYEEVDTSDGLQPGFYLIANVFGTQKYFENFMKTLQTKGLEPKYFYRDLNGYNYVYLKRYDSMKEAREARDSKFNGRYTEKLWIFRVKGN